MWRQQNTKRITGRKLQILVQPLFLLYVWISPSVAPIKLTHRRSVWDTQPSLPRGLVTSAANGPSFLELMLMKQQVFVLLQWLLSLSRSRFQYRWGWEWLRLFCWPGMMGLGNLWLSAVATATSVVVVSLLFYFLSRNHFVFQRFFTIFSFSRSCADSNSIEHFFFHSFGITDSIFYVWRLLLGFLVGGGETGRCQQWQDRRTMEGNVDDDQRKNLPIRRYRNLCRLPPPGSIRIWTFFEPLLNSSKSERGSDAIDSTRLGVLLLPSINSVPGGLRRNDHARRAHASTREESGLLHIRGVFRSPARKIQYE